MPALTRRTISGPGETRTAAWRLYDISGNGKTVAKASYGRYNQQLGDSYSTFYNPNTLLTTTYLWHDLITTTTTTRER